MTFVVERARSGRRPGYIVDVHWDTGLIRYCDFQVPLGEDMQAIVGGVQVAPTRKSTGSGLGSRSVYNIKLNDSVADDGVGTVLGRQLAANPGTHNRQIDIYVGYITEPFDISNFQKRTYFIDSITALNDKNFITINTLDPLQSLNNKRSVAPLASFGKLSVAISDSFTGNIDIGDTTNFDTFGTCVIDRELISYSLVNSTTINIFLRGLEGTTAASHALDASVKNSFVRFNENVVDTIRALILTFTDIPASFIDNTEWNAERDDYLATEVLTTVVPTSVSVKQTIDRLCEMCGISLWWDERDGEIKLKSDQPGIFPDFELNTTENVLDVGHAQKLNMQKLVTRVIYHYNKIDALGDDTPENYQDTLEQIDAGAEIEQDDMGIVEIFGAFVDTTGTAVKVATRLLNRRKQGAKQVTFKLDPKDGDVWTGSDIRLTSDLFQDEDGLDRAFAIEVTEVKEEGGLRYSYVGTIISEEAHNLYALIGPNSLLDYASETQENRDRYGFISTDPPNPQMSDGTPAYRIL